MSTNQQQKNEEEVDLGSLFVIIGRGFRNFFNFIGNIFKSIFHFIILILIFLKTNILKIGIAAFIGGVIGVYFEVTLPESYGSKMILEPNFKSTRQLYNNINYYNDLVKQKDTNALQAVFGISLEEAASLKKFEIEPIVINNDIIDGYDMLITEVDTLTIKSYEFSDFKASFTLYDYKMHEVTVTAKKNDVFQKVGNVIISSITNNKYFSRLKELTNQNLNRTDSVYKQSLVQVDSLRKVYMQVMLEKAKKDSPSTSIDLGGTKESTKEIELFETNRKINNDLKDLAEDKAEKYEVLNVISNFQPVGYKIAGVTTNKGFLLALIFSLLMILFLLLQKLNSYLNSYNK